MEWIVKRASELYVSSSGLSKSADQFGFGYPFLSYIDIFHNYYAPSELNTLVNSSEKDRKNYSVKKGDVFLTRTSETTEELGMSCVALKDYPYATFNGFAKRLRPLTEEIAPIYATYFFRSSFFRSQCMSMASLITRASLNDSNIRKLKIKFPKSREIQEKIGKTLFCYDNLIENNTKRIRLLERMAENLYKEWFVRFRFPGYKNAEFIDGLPKGWTIEKVGTWCRVFTGKKDVNQTVDNGKYIFFSCSPAIFYSDDYIYDGKAIIVAGNGSYTGRTRFFSGKFDLYQRTYAIVPIDELAENIILYLYARFKFGFEKVYSGGTRGSAIPYIVMKDITHYKFLYNAEIIRKYAHIAESLFYEIEKLQRQSILLARQRDLLLPRLMSGKLEVKA